MQEWSVLTVDGGRGVTMSGKPSGDGRRSSLRITEIVFRAGASPSAHPLRLAVGNVTILVGPNNAGKSSALREIEYACTRIPVPSPTPPKTTSPQVVTWVTLDLPQTPADALEWMRPFKHPVEQPPYAPDNEQFSVAYPLSNGGTNQAQVSTAYFQQSIGPSGNHEMVRSAIMPPRAIRLDGRTRFSIPMAGPTGSLVARPTTYLQGLFHNDGARHKLQDITHDAFGQYVAIDASTEPGQLFLRMSDRRPPTEYDRSLTTEAALYFAQQPLLTTFGDGVQAFVALVGTVIGSPYKVILIDEPEAFLPPPIARRLGAELTRIVNERDASLVIATHDADFLMGCIAESRDTAVVRLTYDSGVPTARGLTPSELAPMMYHPLFRSTGALHALFHHAAIVTESDADRAFYDEINHRLQGVGRGIKDALFLNAQNWQTEHEIVRPLRRIGIPAAAVVDLDVILKTGTDWDNLFDACNVARDRRQHLWTERDYIQSVLLSLYDDKDDVKAVVKKQGLAVLNDADCLRAHRLLDDLAVYGLFIVPVGDLESWLNDLQVKGHAARWLIGIFTRIAALQETEHPLQPGGDDVWVFVDRVATWINNPRRGGMA